jgi:hypothetical protein
MRILGFLSLLFVWGAQQPLAEAQDFETAAKHFGAAQDAFSKQHFHAAAAEFQLAYEITKDPVLLYNIGEAWQKAGEGKKAVASYKSYLNAQPNAQDRPDVLKRIKLIESKKYQIADQSAPGDAPSTALAEANPLATPPTAAPPAPAPSPAPEVTPQPPASPSAAPTPEAQGLPPPAPTPSVAPPAPAVVPGPVPVKEEKPAEPPAGLLDEGPVSRLRVGAWIGVAATVAVLTAGAIFGLAAQSRADEISRRFVFVDSSTGQPRPFDAAAQKDYRSLKDDGELYNGLAIGFFTGAGALAVTTAVLFVVDARRPQRHALQLAPMVGTRQAGLQLGWSF